MHPVLRLLADRQHGVFTAADALRAGYGPAEIRRNWTAGTWIRLRRGVYIAAADLPSDDKSGKRHLIDCLAALISLDRPAAAVSHGSAARLWGFPVRRSLDRTVRLTDPQQWRRGRGFLVSGAPLQPAEIRSFGKVRVTTPARTLLDCAREWPLEDAVVAMDAALLAMRSTRGELAEAAAGQRLWRGGARAARAASFADGRAESALETRGRLRLIAAGIPPSALQVEIRIGSRLVAVVDAWYEDAALAIEFDGKVKYTDPWRDPGRVLWEEKLREDDLRSLDIRVVRIIDQDLTAVRWPRKEQRLHELLAHPGPSIRRFTTVEKAHGVRRSA